MYTLYSNKTLVLMTLLMILLASCAPAEVGTVTLSPSGEEESQQVGVPGNAGPESTAGDYPEDMEAEDPMFSFDSSTWKTYTDETYKFSIRYPEYFEIKSTSQDDLAPKPLTIIHFYDTQNELSMELDQPSFSIRIFNNQGQQTLKAWLNANGFGNKVEWVLEAYDNNRFTGVKVLSTNFMFPGEFVFVQHEEWIFQLIPLSEEANTMLDTSDFFK